LRLAHAPPALEWRAGEGIIWDQVIPTGSVIVVVLVVVVVVEARVEVVVVEVIVVVVGTGVGELLFEQPKLETKTKANNARKAQK